MQVNGNYLQRQMGVVMDCEYAGVLQDVVVSLRSKAGEWRYLALTEAKKDAIEIVGNHFGNRIALPCADIVSSVSIRTGRDLGWENP